MRITIFACLALWLLGVVLAQEAKPLCPRHVEPPFYPHVARVAHVQGKVILLVTIDADGKVIDAEATNDEQRVSLLKLSTTSSIRRWTFTKPPFAPYKQMITYDYQLDESLPLDGPSTVVFDLPDRVTIVTSDVSVQTSRSK